MSMNNAIAKTLGVVALFLGLLATLAFLCSKPDGQAPQSAIVVISGLIGTVGAGLVPFLLSKNSDGSKRGGGPGGIAGVLLAGLTSLATHGCSEPAKYAEPREVARASVLMTSNALATTDQVCSALALQTKDIALAKRCAAVYKIVRASLVSAADGVDTWEALETSRITVTCALVASVQNLTALVVEIRGKGGKGLDAVDDAAKFIRSLGACSDTRDATSVSVADSGGDQ